jgi:DNA-binding NtrC family response regulator
MREFLRRVLPGKSRRIVDLREEILNFCASLTTRTLLLQGPIGSGKSTIARVIALLKRVAPLNANAAREILEDVAFGGPNLIDLNSIPWYVELALTGLVPELVDVQLFGVAKGTYTDASERAGVFELAMYGRRKRGVDTRSEAVAMTGGIVFLDEVGDLLPAHQAKLLPVLSGGVFYRLGTEGNLGEELVFNGTLITATWKTLTNGTLRADLLSRISANRILVPGISDRMDDFEEILKALEGGVRNRITASIKEIMRVEPLAAKDYWAARLETIQVLSTGDRKHLTRVDWARHGNLRGLTAVVEMILMRGINTEDAVAMLPPLDQDALAEDPTSAMLSGLLRRSPSNEGLAAHISALERHVRASLRDRLRSDPGLLSDLAERLRIPLDNLAYQVQQLGRDRTRGKAS